MCLSMFENVDTWTDQRTRGCRQESGSLTWRFISFTSSELKQFSDFFCILIPCINKLISVASIKFYAVTSFENSTVETKEKFISCNIL